MHRIALLAVVLLALTIASPIWAQGCHGGGSGCPMSGCPGSGQTMTDVSGKITTIGDKHDVVTVKAGSKTLQLLVHPNCPNKDQLIKQIGQLKVRQTLKGSYYTLNSKTYLCTIGSSGSCH